MATNIRLTLNLEIDDEPLKGFPLVRRISVDETQAANYEKTSGAGFVDIPIAELGTIQFLLIRPDQQTSYQFADATPGNITINAGGFMLLFDANQTVTPEVENTSGSTALVKVQAGGT